MSQLTNDLGEEYKNITVNPDKVSGVPTNYASSASKKQSTKSKSSKRKEGSSKTKESKSTKSKYASQNTGPYTSQTPTTASHHYSYYSTPSHLPTSVSPVQSSSSEDWERFKAIALKVREGREWNLVRSILVSGQGPGLHSKRFVIKINLLRKKEYLEQKQREMVKYPLLLMLKRWRLSQKAMYVLKQLLGTAPLDMRRHDQMETLLDNLDTVDRQLSLFTKRIAETVDKEHDKAAEATTPLTKKEIIESFQQFSPPPYSPPPRFISSMISPPSMKSSHPAYPSTKKPSKSTRVPTPSLSRSYPTTLSRQTPTKTNMSLIEPIKSKSKPIEEKTTEVKPISSGLLTKDRLETAIQAPEEQITVEPPTSSTPTTPAQAVAPPPTKSPGSTKAPAPTKVEPESSKSLTSMSSELSMENTSFTNDSPDESRRSLTGDSPDESDKLIEDVSSGEQEAASKGPEEKTKAYEPITKEPDATTKATKPDSTTKPYDPTIKAHDSFTKANAPTTKGEVPATKELEPTIKANGSINKEQEPTTKDASSKGIQQKSEKSIKRGSEATTAAYYFPNEIITPFMNQPSTSKIQNWMEKLRTSKSNKLDDTMTKKMTPGLNISKNKLVTDTLRRTKSKSLDKSSHSIKRKSYSSGRKYYSSTSESSSSRFTSSSNNSQSTNTKSTDSRTLYIPIEWMERKPSNMTDDQWVMAYLSVSDMVQTNK